MVKLKKNLKLEISKAKTVLLWVLLRKKSGEVWDNWKAIFSKLCGNGDLGDEYHYLFVCKDKYLLHFRIFFLPNFYWKNQSMFKYITLMGEISSKKKLSRLVSVLCKEIIITVKQ